MKNFPICILLIICVNANAQELFLVTEPASNIPAKTINIRSSNYLMNKNNSIKKSFHAMPELALGVTNKLMLRVSAVTSSLGGVFGLEGFNAYAKYRFYSSDKVHQHLRAAVFARYTSNISPVHMQEINLMMHNSGMEMGVVATQLLHKTAFNANISMVRAVNTNRNPFIYAKGQNGIGYALSVGQLILPKTYTSYKQTNVNAMVEFLGQYNVGLKKHYVDAVPAIQFIFNSVLCVDLGYRFNLSSNLIRNYNEGYIFKIEYNFFNALK